MEKVLVINNLCKDYPKFKLKNVTFSVERGQIMGFIGRNGAGKTTTLKTILNLVHPTKGTVEFFGKNFIENEKEIKQRIGYASGGINYYQKNKLKDIVATTSTFYSNWDNERYRYFMDYFSLDEEKKPAELSEGMKVKFNLTLALSHHAEFLILDEPTSGLDPVSRDDLLEVFMDLSAKGVAILFSTHITSDLDKCADAITYIKGGNILASANTEEFIDSYRLIDINNELSDDQKKCILGISKNRKGSTALIHKSDVVNFEGQEMTLPNLEQIMGHLEKER